MQGCSAKRYTSGDSGIEDLVASCNEEWERLLYILCCASGLRISEALALDREHLSDDCSVIQVRQQVKGNKIVSCLKTDAAWRDVDLHRVVAGLLEESVGRRAGLLFPHGQARRGRIQIPTIAACAPVWTDSGSTCLGLVRTVSVDSGQRN